MSDFPSQLLPVNAVNMIATENVESNNQLEPPQLEDESFTEENGEKKLPLLPPPREGNGEYKEFSLGETVKMDDLGPMIITPEGHIRRIANWDTMTKAEQAVAWRRISARNKVRIDALKEAQREQEQSDASATQNERKEEPLQSNEQHTNDDL